LSAEATFGLLQRAFAAFRALALRCAGVSF